MSTTSTSMATDSPLMATRPTFSTPMATKLLPSSMATSPHGHQPYGKQLHKLPTLMATNVSMATAPTPMVTRPTS